MESLIKLAEAETVTDNVNTDLPSVVEISEQEVERITAEASQKYNKIFALKLEEDRKNLIKEKEILDAKKDKLRKAYEKKIANKCKELELENLKQIRELTKSQRDEIKQKKEEIKRSIQNEKDEIKKNHQLKVLVV